MLYFADSEWSTLDTVITGGIIIFIALGMLYYGIKRRRTKKTEDFEDRKS